MYTPSHLTWLDKQSQQRDGWPTFVSEEAKAYALKMLRRGFDKYKDISMTLDLAYRCIFDDYVCTKEDGPKPECLKVSLWDAVYAVTHRALLEVGATQVWILTKEVK